MKFLNFVYDYYFELIVPGLAITGISLGLVLYNFLKNRNINSGPLFATAAPAVSATLILPFHLPLDSTITFFIITATLLVPFLCWAFGTAIIVFESPERAHILHALWISGIIIGIGSAPWLSAYYGNGVGPSWFLVLGLAFAAMIASRGKWILFATCCAIVVITLAILQKTDTKSEFPQWPSANQLKPVLGAIAAGKSMKSITRFLGNHSRLDVAVINNGKQQEIGWLLTNGTSPTDLSLTGKIEPSSWWEDHYPLLVIPFELSKGNKIISIGAAPGPEIVLASSAGNKDIRVFTYDSELREFYYYNHNVMNRMLPNDNVTIDYGDVRSKLKSLANDVDIIFLSTTHPGKSGWFGSNRQEGSLYTTQAFTTYLNKLNANGLLAVTTREEVLFDRVLLTAWEAIEHIHGSPVNFSDYAFGLRLVQLAPFKGSYQYLLIVSKAGITSPLQTRLMNLIDQLPVEMVFGAGGDPIKPYHLLGHRHDLDGAKIFLTNLVSRYYKKMSDIVPTSDDRPYFFNVLRDLHPYLKWLLTMSLVVLIIILMFPLSLLRRHIITQNLKTAPVPVTLGYFVLVGAGLTMLIVGVFQQLMLWQVFSPNIGYLILAPLVLGYGASLIAFPFLNRAMLPNLQRHAPLSASLTIYMCGCLLTSISPSAADWLEDVYIYSLSLLLFVGGFFIGTAIQYGFTRIPREPVNIRSWAWMSFGLAATAGTILAHWLSQYWGWRLTWISTSSCYLIAYCCALWAWPSIKKNLRDLNLTIQQSKPKHAN